MPYTEPFGVVHYAGIRRYLWQDVWWTEVDLNYHRVHNIAEAKWYALKQDIWKHLDTPDEEAYNNKVRRAAAIVRLLKMFRVLPPPQQDTALSVSFQQAGIPPVFVRAIRQIDKP